MNDAKKIVTHPDDVAVLKKIARGWGKNKSWDFSTPGQVSFADDDDDDKGFDTKLQSKRI